MLLKEFVELGHYKFAEEAASWEDAVRMSCETLEADGTVEADYKEEIIECIRKYGPYIIIIPNVAMPHSQEGAKGVHKTAIGFMKLNKPAALNRGTRKRTQGFSLPLLPAIRSSIW